MAATKFQMSWDETSKRDFETGVDRGVFYPMDSTGAYPAGYEWNGLTGVSESPEGGEPTALYADNIKYLELTSAENYKATIEAYTYPEKFEEIDGTSEIVPGVTIGQQERKKFGFCYRTKKGNDVEGESHGYKIHCIYGLLAEPSDKSYETVNESPDAITFSWGVSSTPVAVNGYKPTSCIVIDSTKVSKEKLTAVETVLYGVAGESGASVAARLPLPDELISMLRA